MPSFTIESTYRLPVFRHRTYEAATIDDACRLAINDGDWTGQKEDYESSGPTYLTGIWPGADTAYMATACSVPAGFGEGERQTQPDRPGDGTVNQAVGPASASPVMPRCRHCGSADICRDANAVWDEVAQAWSLLATYDSQTCERCGADSNNLALWVPVVEPGTAAAFRWEVIQVLEDASLAGNADFQRFCDDRHGQQPASEAAACWLTPSPS
ncbi:MULTISPECIES: hypothetical protein [Sphingobium]|jgi:hypothetical protein|uniref:Uncharacterized protein n=1 Tax=Sphingobium lactosutens DS20 TaxID=1331060 RepID=T0HXL8_9SPHN|nr:MULTISPECIES: hypothetical protein [Sphingobium]EQB16818.1 hypothetical protein RLDS_06785 [Sphingobium lactosutens DS20]